MVDLFGMFRRRPAKRNPGFARSRDDITALGDFFGKMLTSPARDASSMARAAPVPGVELPRPAPEPAREEKRARAKPARTNGASAPRLIKRSGYLAVHSVEKSFGTRQVVRGVSIYVRRGEAVGLLGPNGAGKTTVFYMITGLIKADRGAIELDGHDVTKLPMYQRARLGIGYLPQEASIFRGLSVEQNIRAVLEVVEPSRKKREAELDALLDEFNITRLRKPRRSRYPAASGAASRSRVRWRRGPTTCCSTNPSPASTRSRSATSRIWSAISPIAASAS